MVLLVQVISPDHPEIAIVHQIRQRVFLDEYGLDPALDTEPSDEDPTTLHFLGFDTETRQHVAVARSVVVPGTQSVQLGRIAVLPETRGRGHGLSLMQFAVKYIQSWDAVPIQKMFLMCPENKVGFYEKCGFTNAQRCELVRGLTLYEMVQYCDA